MALALEQRPGVIMAAAGPRSRQAVHGDGFREGAGRGRRSGAAFVGCNRLPAAPLPDIGFELWVHLEPGFLR